MSVYAPTYEGLRVKLKGRDLESLVERSGAVRVDDRTIGLRCAGREYRIGYPEGTVADVDGAPVDVHLAILLLLYLLDSTGCEPEGRWVSFEQLPGGLGYLSSFHGRVVQPILHAFGPHPERLLEAARALGGEPMALGDVAVSIPALPRVSIACVLWRGDEEFRPSASVVFDASVAGYLDTEALVALSELVSRRMVAADAYAE
ncbi:MAG: DUF3786 domain-containing protein [Armatimonadetes bacterium]|nr:DUF3786 domain-containing protein [Armatimonadota bacterium]